jgi:hypothetical protein
MRKRVALETVETSTAEYMECGGKRSATPLWSQRAGLTKQKRRRRSALPAHCKWYTRCAPFNVLV